MQKGVLQEPLRAKICLIMKAYSEMHKYISDSESKYTIITGTVHPVLPRDLAISDKRADAFSMTHADGVIELGNSFLTLLISGCNGTVKSLANHLIDEVTDLFTQTPWAHAMIGRTKLATRQRLSDSRMRTLLHPRSRAPKRMPAQTGDMVWW